MASPARSRVARAPTVPGPSAEPPELLTRQALAALLGKHPQTISKWLEEGLPVARRGRGGRPSLFAEAEVRAWVQQREEVAQAAGAIDVNHARARKEHWQACLAEQLHHMRAKTLLPAEEVAKAWMAAIAGARSVILAAYATASDRVFRAALKGALPGVEREMQAVAHEVLRELADGRSEDVA